MAITATAVDSTTTSTLTPTFNFGFTANAGDLIVFGVCVDAGVTGIAWPGSWVELREAVPTNARAAVGYLIASGGETSVQLTGTGTADRWEGVFHRIPAGEWHGTTVPEAPAAATGNSANPNPPSVTPSWGAHAANIFLVYAARDDSVANTITAYPTNYSTAQADSNAITSAGNMGGAARINANVSPEDPGTFTISASETWAAFTVAVRGASASTTTLTPGPVAVTLAVPAPTFGTTLAFQPAPVAAVLTVPAPTLATPLSLSPAPVAAVLAVPAPTLATPLALSPAPVAVVLVVPNSTLGAPPIVLTPDPVAAVLAVPAPTLATPLSLAPAPVAAVLAVPVPALATPLSLSPAPVPAVLAVPAPTLATSLSLAPAPVPVVLVLTAQTVSSVYTLAPAPVPVVLSVTSPTLGLILSLSPEPIPLVLTVPAPTFAGGAGVVHTIPFDALNTEPRWVVRYPWYRKGLRPRN